MEVQLLVQTGEEKWRKDAAVRGNGDDGQEISDLLLPVRQEIGDPPSSRVRHVQLGERVLQQSRPGGWS